MNPIRIDRHHADAIECAKRIRVHFAAHVSSAKSVVGSLVGQAVEPDPVAVATHSTDFTTVKWFGTAYTFDDGLQAKAVGELWGEFEKGEHGLSEKTIGERIGSSANNYRLANTFRYHPAWGTMIVKVRQGIYRLQKPK
jgi:hypothetical protein